jgi:hypothetical protein
VPIILTSRADSVHARLASCAVAVLFAAELRRGAALLKAAAQRPWIPAFSSSMRASMVAVDGPPPEQL